MFFRRHFLHQKQRGGILRLWISECVLHLKNLRKVWKKCLTILYYLLASQMDCVKSLLFFPANNANYIGNNAYCIMLVSIILVMLIM